MHNNKKQFTTSEADTIFNNMKEKWDSWKKTEWPDYRGHDEPSLYPKYLHVSALAGVRTETDALTGVKTQVPWVEKGVTYNNGRNKEKREKRNA